MGKKVKYAAMATLAGTLLGGGCLGGLPWQQLLWVTAIQQAAEFALDNDGVFDLWEDGGVAAAAN